MIEFIAGVFVGVIITGVAIFLSALICQSEETLNKNYWPEDEEVKPTVILCKPGEIETARRIINE